VEDFGVETHPGQEYESFKGSRLWQPLYESHGVFRASMGAILWHCLKKKKASWGVVREVIIQRESRVYVSVGRTALVCLFRWERVDCSCVPFKVGSSVLCDLFSSPSLQLSLQSPVGAFFLTNSPFWKDWWWKRPVVCHLAGRVGALSFCWLSAGKLDTFVSCL
jgi:hypothetical protein